MTKQLSPAAQAVRDAAFSVYWSAEQEDPNDEQMIAAALRAVAAQMFPINYVVIDNCQYEVPSPEREQILAIAAELAALAQPEPVAPTDKELMDLAEEVWVPFAKSQPHPQGHPWDLVLARAVLARWGCQ